MKIEFKWFHPGDDKNRKRCSDCKRLFRKGEEQINTATHTRYVTLCKSCYEKAGNNVR